MAKSKKIVYIAQLHFRIGVMKDFLAIGDFLTSRGVDVRYILSDGYRPHIRRDLLGKTIFIKTVSGRYGLAFDLLKFITFDWLFWWRFFKDEKPHYLLLYLVHPISSLIFLIGRMTAPACRFGLCLHEPKTYKRVVQLKGKIVAYIREISQKFNMLCAHDVLLFSPFAEKLFKENYRFNGSIHRVNFVYPHLDQTPYKKRNAVNISGTLFPDYRSHFFSELVLMGKEKYPEIKFRLVTNRLDKEIENLVKLNPHNFELINPNFLLDEELLKNIRHGVCQLFGHQNITQSGVLPIALQCGTPILAPDIPGFNQFITHKKEGYLVKPDAALEEWFVGIYYIINHFDELSNSCIRTFKKYFSPERLDKYYSWILPKDNIII